MSLNEKSNKIITQTSKKFKRRKVYAWFKDNMSAIDLVGMR